MPWLPSTARCGLLADQTSDVTRIDARTGAVTGTIRVGDAPAALASGPSGLWVLDPLDATASRIDPGRAAVTMTVAAGGQPTDVLQADGSVWIADRPGGTLLRLAPGPDAVTRFELGGQLSALAAADGGLWAAIDAAGTESPRRHPHHRQRGRRRRHDRPGRGNLDRRAPPPQLLGLTNDGLVTLNHVAGPDGPGWSRTSRWRCPRPPATDAPTRSACARASAIRPARSSGPATSPAPSSGCSSSGRRRHTVLPGHQRRRRVPEGPGDL